MKLEDLNISDGLRPLAVEVFQSYQEGVPVVIIAKDHGILHGEETLKTIAETGLAFFTVKVHGVDRAEFEAGDFPEFAEAARLAWIDRVEQTVRSKIHNVVTELCSKGVPTEKIAKMLHECLDEVLTGPGHSGEAVQ
jgi:hypothetical protein